MILSIVYRVMVPIIIPMVIGFIVRKTVKFDISALAKIQFYILIPALLFVKIYDANLSGSVVGQTLIHSSLLFFILLGISYAFSKIMKYSKAKRGAVVNSVTLYNGGNFCLPLMEMLFHNPTAISIQALIILAQSIITNTFGIFNASDGKYSKKRAIIEILKVPMIYAALVAFIFRLTNLTMPEPIYMPLSMLSDALVPMALITLGAQLAQIKSGMIQKGFVFSSVTRLIISPIIAYLLIIVMGIDGMLAQILLISAGAPVAVNAVLLAIEYDGEPEFVAKNVLVTTVLSVITVSVISLIANILFPIL